MAGPQRKPNILLIDDDPDLVAALKRILEAEGYSVRCAGDGDEGVRMASAAPPDLVILDYMMPVKDGFEACRDIRALPQTRDVPILALTAFGRDIGEDYGLNREEARLHDFLEKPVEPNILLARVAAALAGPACDGPLASKESETR